MTARPALERIRLDAVCWLEYRPGWLAGDAAAELMRAVLAEVAFGQRRIRLWGREVLQPRLIAWAGSRSYRYSGDTLAPRAATPAVAAVLERVVAATGIAFDHVLLNLYRDGQDSMGMHADDEPELGPDPAVASLSLGAPRRLVLRARAGAGPPLRLTLGHGSLLVMRGSTQRRYKHGVPKDPKVTAPRLNLTFRRVVAG